MGTHLPLPKGAQPPIFGPYLLYIPGAAAPSEALDPAKGLYRLKSMKKPIFLLHNLARQFLKNEAIHRASPVHSQQEYIATGLALSKNICSPAIHRASPVYSQMGYIGTGLDLYKNILSPAIHRASAVYSR